MIKKCVVCGSEFESKTDKAKYCCKKCANHSRFNKTLEQIRDENKELQNRVLTLYKKGLKDAEIASLVGKSVSWVFKKRTEMGLPRNISERQLKIRARKRELAQMEFRICKQCHKTFIPIRVNQLFCCKSCEKRSNHQVNDIKRKRLEKQQAVDDISLDDVYKKYDGICYLCGEKCDYNDVRYVNGVPHPLGNYPTREHIIPLSKGGLHTWTNVKLAHLRCNSSKGVKYG